jgi:hypothetical protein
VEQAKKEEKYHLILIGGVPGSGKTLVGLQFIHEIISEAEFGLFLSGNGPLVKTLQNYLGPTGKTLIRDISAFIQDYYFLNRKLSTTHVIAFDEAQRAWDAKQISRYYGRKEKKFQALNIPDAMLQQSEPDILTSIVSQMEKWGVLIGLIGDGQVIHKGEEGGITAWQNAIANSKVHWIVHTPPRFQEIFQSETNCNYILEKELDLTDSLRSHAAQQLSDFVNQLMAANLNGILEIAQNLKQSGFFLYFTEDLDHAQQYLRSLYADQSEKTYGIIASSTATNLKQYGINVKDHTDPTCHCTMFYGANDVPYYYYKHENSKRPNLYCTAFQKVVREFDCQGLELDSIILAWGSDLIWNDSKAIWQIHAKRMGTKDPDLICLNTYRVLLTRARDGIILYCPGKELTTTRILLSTIGFEQLENYIIEEKKMKN